MKIKNPFFKKKTNINLIDICKILKIKKINSSIKLNNINDLKSANKNDISFFNSLKYTNVLKNTKSKYVITNKKYAEIVAKFSKPLILMGYYQMIFNFGEKKFIKKCKEAGVNGLIVVDLSYPDNKKFAQLCKKNSICFVQLIAPTTSIKRMREILKISHSMVYMISMISTTGSALKITTKKIMKNYEIIKKISPNKNVAIGFGITEKTVKSLKKADALVVGSRLCKEISKSIKNKHNPVIMVSKVVKKLKSKII